MAVVDRGPPVFHGRGAGVRGGLYRKKWMEVKMNRGLKWWVIRILGMLCILPMILMVLALVYVLFWRMATDQMWINLTIVGAAVLFGIGVGLITARV